MKKNILIIFTVCLLVSLIYLLIRNFYSGTEPEKSFETSFAKGAQERKLTFDGQELSYNIIKVEKPEDLILIDNLKLKNTAKKAYSDNSCSVLVSGSFYTKEGSFIGLFISGGKKLSNYTGNSTFNGVLSVNDFSVPRITRQVPKDRLTTAVQSGPILIENGKVLPVKFVNDKNARRVVGAVDGSNTLYFLAIYKASQLFDGPAISNLPAVVSEIGKDNNVVWADAINLDGGTASAYVSKDSVLTELSSVGSFFCLR